MRSRVAEYDVRRPAPVWGLDGYRELLLLVREGARPLGMARIPLRRGRGALSAAEIERHVSQMHPGAHPLRDAAPMLRPLQDAPAISVVVCTKDRPRPLGRCLKALQGIDYPRYEILVVDNASAGDTTKNVCVRFGVRCVREERPGLDNARNRGLDEAAYDVIAFVDDDVQVDGGWLRALGRAFEDDRVDAVTGLVLPLELETPAQDFFELYGDGMSKGFEPRLFEGGLLDEHELIAAHRVGVGANMAARRGAYRQVGGFDPALDVGTPACGAGDLDMFHRLLVAGKTILYDPLVVARHQHRRDMDGLTVQIHNNGRAFGVYLLKLLRDRTVRRRSVLKYASGTWARWLLGRLTLGLIRRHPLPTRLLWAEVRGALASPLAFRATYRNRS